MKLGILLCDSPAEHLVEIHGNYFQQFTALLKNKHIETFPYDIVNGSFPNINDMDCYLISGSKHSVYEDLSWISKLKDFIRNCDQEGKKIVGICFGHQAIASALGGVVVKNPLGWEISNTLVDLKEQGREYFAKDSLRIQEMHQDHVTKVPEGFQVLGSTAISPVQIMIKPGKFLTIQGHPEFTAGYTRAVIEMRRDKGIFKLDFAEMHLKTVDVDNDSALIAEKIQQFLFNQ